LNLPTFTSHATVVSYAIPQVTAFLVTLVYGSFFEWTLHRNIMHRRTWLSFPFEVHALLHHKIFRHDRTFHALDEEMKRHVTFVPRDYIVLMMVNTPVFLAVEWLFQLPVLLGGWAAVLLYLGMFDFLHWSFHVPRGRRMERWFLVRWLKEHHRIHHQHQNRNFNVVLPLADTLLGTRWAPRRGARKTRDGAIAALLDPAHQSARAPARRA
jgi:hypothetical protein